MNFIFYRNTFFVLFLAVFSFLYGCNSSDWSDAQQTNTYEAYQSYIAENPEGKHLKEARQRADSLYWSSIKEDTTAQVFKKYLNKFPNGQFRPEAQQKKKQFTPAHKLATKGRVTGSGVIIRSDHTTESSSAGVVAKKGTIVQILDQYNSTDGSEAILKRSVSVTSNGRKLSLPKGKAIQIESDTGDSVKASFSTPQFGATQGVIGKSNIEAMAGQKWYKIHTTDDLTGWIYGKFIEEL